MNELLQFTAPTDLIPLKNVFRYRVEKTGWSVPDIGESDGMEIPCRALNREEYFTTARRNDLPVASIDRKGIR